MIRLAMGLLVVCAIGCSESALETGYKPHALSDSPAMRRSYYASPFTPASKAPQMEQDQELQARRPRPGY
ncbi:MAG TPA: hypothetical protein VHD56_18510 [Tepidisphaeraceae bacterium]|nr:hypothetical protein [Tepidisphaeraceae bacterium]